MKRELITRLVVRETSHRLSKRYGVRFEVKYPDRHDEIIYPAVIIYNGRLNSNYLSYGVAKMVILDILPRPHAPGKDRCQTQGLQFTQHSQTPFPQLNNGSP